MSRIMRIFKCHILLECLGEPMQESVNTNDNINGTLVLPLWQDSDSMAEGSEAGVPRSLKNQIETVLSAGDFKAKSGTAMTLAGTDGGKALLIGLGKPGDATLQSCGLADCNCKEVLVLLPYPKIFSLLEIGRAHV